jgi:hypothetical protein
MDGNLQNSASKRRNHHCLGFPRCEHALNYQDGDEDQSGLGDNVDCADEGPARDLRMVSKSEIRCIFTREGHQRGRPERQTREREIRGIQER